MSIKEFYPLKSGILIHLAVLTAINILLLFIPLTNVFGYEFAAVNALVLFFQSGIFTISGFKKIQNGFDILPVVKMLTGGFIFFIIIPPVISLVNSALTGGCSYSDGFLFYLFITLPSVFGGSAVGLLIFSLLNRYRRPVFLGVYFLLFLIPFAEFYFNPQVYFYTPLIGYFPGVIYDEGLSINSQMIIYRLLNMLFFSFIFFSSLFLIGKKLKYRIITFSAAVLIAALFMYFSPLLGFSTTKGSLSSELTKKIETRHFIIYFSERIEDNFIRLITLQHEYYYTELKDYFKTAPAQKITSFVFYDPEEKKELMGSENADLAKPWLYELFTSYFNYNSTLKHELAHVFTAEFGKGILKIADNYNPSLIEGIAMAADPVYGENNLDYMAALAYNNGYKTDLTRIYDYLNFFKQNSSLSYIYAGSFTKYLVDKYGIGRYKILYRDFDFQNVYHKNFETITEEYYKYLKSLKHSYNTDAANYYFGKKSIFFKKCPRYVNDQIKEAWNKFDKKNYCDARDIFKRSYDLSNDYSALFGYVNSLSKLKERTAAIDILQQDINKFEGTSAYYNLELRLADLYAEEGKSENADSLYLELIRQNPGRNFFYIANARMTLSRDKNLVKWYLNGSDFTKYYILKKLFDQKNDYNLIPIMIDLSKRVEEDYWLFISQFSNNIADETYESSYAFYKLSNYMLENLDFVNAKKMSSLALRFREDENFTYLLLKNHKKIIWLQNNQETLLAAIQDQM